MGSELLRGPSKGVHMIIVLSNYLCEQPNLIPYRNYSLLIDRHNRILL